MKRVLVTLVSVGLIAGMATLIPLLAGDPASATTPCGSRHQHLVHAQQRVRHDRAKLATDRRHHRTKAAKQDQKRLAGDRHKARDAQLRWKLCKANHKPSASPQSSSSDPTGSPVGLPTDPSALCSALGRPADCLTSTPTVSPTDPGDLCSLLGLPPDCLSTLPTGLTATQASSSTTSPISLPAWVTDLYTGDVPPTALTLLEADFGSPLPPISPGTTAICTVLSGLPIGIRPATCPGLVLP